MKEHGYQYYHIGFLTSFSCGAQFVKCGFAGENFPTAVFPCMVGRPTLRFEETNTEYKLDVCYGHIIYWIRSSMH